MNLVTHCGARRVERVAVGRVETPAATSTWTPIPHSRLLEQVEASVTGSGLDVVSQAHALSRDGLRYFGLLEVSDGRANEDYGLVLGLRNSHDKTFPAGLALGSGVFICDNLAFSAEVVIARRHTRFIDRDLPGLVQDAVGQLGELRLSQDRRIEAYRNTPLSTPRAHHLLLCAMQAGIVMPTRLPIAASEWARPRHEEFAAGGRTAWRLFNACTEAVKGTGPDLLLQRTRRLHGLLDTACGLTH